MSIQIEKAIAKQNETHPGKVTEWYKDGDGYWAYLSHPWIAGSTETRTIHEWNVKDFLVALKNTFIDVNS